jgi:dienelactone hydrolase
LASCHLYSACCTRTMANNKQYHLVVVCHGLWGSPAHVKTIIAHLREKAESHVHSGDNVELVVVPVSTNEGAHTYDGIDFCAERVVAEIDRQVDQLQADDSSGKVTRFSIVGYAYTSPIALLAISQF